MLTLLLIIIYLSFISLGLPDALLGSAWPVLHSDLDIPVSYAGYISMIISFGTVVSSLFSSKIINRFGTGFATVISVAMTAIALLGIPFSNSLLFICLCAIPLGLGAGTVDAALNNFVATHYAAKHMNWLHCFWGIGASAGPFIMSYYLTKNGNWSGGFLSVGIIQTVLVVILIITLPLWKKAVTANQNVEEKKQVTLPLRKVLKLPYVKPVLLGFFAYCGLELTIGLWCGSYAVGIHGVSGDTAATWTSLYYFGITAGRLLSGFIAIKLSPKSLIRIGELIMFLGAVLLFLPIGIYRVPIAFCIVGLGCAPIYPSTIHRTPAVFGTELSQSVMGMQMAAAYVGSTALPPIFGFLSKYLGLGFFTYFMIAMILLMVICNELSNRKKT